MKNRTRKNKQKAGGVFNFFAKTFVSDNYKVSLASPKVPSIICSICSNTSFQQRNGTIGKSKTADILRGESQTNDMSIYCYFCNDCGNAIIVRDPKVKTTGTYTQLITSTPL